MIWTHDLSPILFEIGPLAVRWYGLMYAAGFLLGYVWIRARIRAGALPLTEQQLDWLTTAVILGVILGGRLGYFVLYRPDLLISNPLEILQVWHGGMASHGGFVGVILALWLAAKKFKISFLRLADEIVLPVALGLMLGRIGNFINGELPGRPTGGDFGIIFPSIDQQPRHPAQLYAAAKDAIIWLDLLALQRLARALPDGFIAFFFVFNYGLFRTIVEGLWREPLDGFIGPLTVGQAYSVPLIIIGAAGMGWLLARRAVTK